MNTSTAEILTSASISTSTLISTLTSTLTSTPILPSVPISTDVSVSIDAHKNVYSELKPILDGCDTILDALHFSKQYIEKYPHMKSMITSYVNGKNYRDTIDIKTKQMMMMDVDRCTSRDDALALVSKISEKTTDDVFKRTLENLAHRKNYKRIENDVNNTNKKLEVFVNKKCPHCRHSINMPENTTYVICGYHNPSTGYDWLGCGRDWCFKCEKILCKRWETDSLNLQINRYHDEECCSKHAKANGYQYPNDYCQCHSLHICTRSYI